MTRYKVVLVIEATESPDTKTDVLKHFRHSNAFQVNETQVQIIAAGIKELKKL